ncbi:MAG TPA: MFS transporter [Longimicrobiales bacterium]|nr:MFS transporter [Longimicrobiales bacterium]
MTTTRARRREVLAWCLYDFGSSAFNTLVLTFIFSLFFAQVIAPDYNTGTVWWTRAVNLSAVAVAFITPVLGAIADSSGRKKAFLVAFAAQSILFTVLLFFAGTTNAMLALGLFVLANVGFEAANVFYWAFLPDVSDDSNIGRVSGLGFFLGYLGGLLSLVIALQMIEKWLPRTDHVNVRATLLLVAGWFLVFALPMFLWVKQRTVAQRELGNPLRIGFHRLYETLKHARHYQEAGKLLLARMIYNDGLATIFAVAAIYLGAVFGMEMRQVLTMAIGLNVFAGVGAFAFGFVDDKIGGKKTILISIVLLIVGTIIGTRVTTIGGFWFAAALLGLMIGPNQAASRSLLSKLVPDDKQAEFFGLYSFSGKVSSLLGPLVYGSVVARTGDHKLAMTSIISFFVVGGIILLFVREREGMMAAGRGI